MDVERPHVSPAISDHRLCEFCLLTYLLCGFVDSSLGLMIDTA